jgi:hypothetical protein
MAETIADFFRRTMPSRPRMQGQTGAGPLTKPCWPGSTSWLVSSVVAGAPADSRTLPRQSARDRRRPIGTWPPKCSDEPSARTLRLKSWERPSGPLRPCRKSTTDWTARSKCLIPLAFQLPA